MDDQEFFTSLRDVRPNAPETEQIRERLRSFIQERPVSRRSSALFGFLRVLYLLRGPFSLQRSFPFLGSAAAAFVFIGAAYAANSALPGSPLYPVKVYVNENVLRGVSGSHTQKTLLEATLTERRLEEVEALAARGELNPQSREQFQRHFRVQVERAEKDVASLRAAGKNVEAMDASAQMESALEAHGEVLRTVVGGSADETMMKDVEEAMLRAVATRTEVEEQVAKQQSRDIDRLAADALERAARRIAVSRTKVDAAAPEKLSVSSQKIMRSGQVSVSVEDENLRAAEESFSEGREKMEQGFHGEAFRLGKEAERRANKAGILQHAREHLGVELKPVPAELHTPEASSATSESSVLSDPLLERDK